MKIANEKDFIPLNNYIIRADKNKKQNITVAGVELYIPTEFKPYLEQNVTQDGIVVHVPLKNTLGLKVGDHVYAHHFLCHEDNEIVIDGEMLYTQDDQSIYAKIENGEMIALADWNILETIEEPEENYQTASGLIFKTDIKKEENSGKIIAISEQSVELGLEKGDIVLFGHKRNKINYAMIIEGKFCYRVATKYLLAKKITSDII